MLIYILLPSLTIVNPPLRLAWACTDVRNIISDDESLQKGILPALREYNLEQFITAEVPGHQHQVGFSLCRSQEHY